MFGWVANPDGVTAVLASLPHAGRLAAAAPHMLGDGQAGDLKPYLAWYEVEIKNPDGALWKPKGDEPPYRAQTGNNCTSEGTGHLIDLLQAMEAADPPADGTDVPVPGRVCIEAMYAFGLAQAGMRGDRGCYGAALARAAHTIGTVSYAIAGQPYDEDRARLRQWATDPSSIVARFRDQAGKFVVGTVVQLQTWDDLVAWVANRGLATLASDVGFESPRQANGVMEARGSWPHQMFCGGVIRSDGIESAVIFQSWGPGNPNGFGPDRRYVENRPFGLPSFAFRARRSAVERILAAGDSWGYRVFPGFERKPLPSRWTWKGFA
jgi:hypothetical protein